MRVGGTFWNIGLTTDRTCGILTGGFELEGFGMSGIRWKTLGMLEMAAGALRDGEEWSDIKAEWPQAERWRMRYPELWADIVDGCDGAHGYGSRLEAGAKIMHGDVW